MKIISKEEFDKADQLPKPLPWRDKVEVPKMTKEEINKILKVLDNPVELQKDIAAKVHLFLQSQMAKEINELGFLKESTRRWINDYNHLLDSLQKNIHGDKHVHAHLHKISHSAIAKHVRKHNSLKAEEVIEAEFNIESNKQDTSRDEEKNNKKV